MTAHSPLATTHRSTAGAPDLARLAWGGDLDIASAPVLTAALEVLVDVQVPTVLLDVSAVAFMDCAGLTALLEADSRLAGGLTLVSPSRAVRRLVRLVELDGRLPVTDASVPVSSVHDTVVDIEQAKGLVMAGFTCTADQAGKILLSTALRHNVQVQVLSSVLVAVAGLELGHLPGGPAQAVRRLLGAAEGVPGDRATTRGPATDDLSGAGTS